MALKDFNDAEIPDLMRFAHGRGMDLTVIETMPMGEIEEDRTDRYLPLSQLRADLEKNFTLIDSDYQTGGPARYVTVKETGGRLGFITPMTHNFCESCNRVRLTCTGTLYMCTGGMTPPICAPRCAPPTATPIFPAPSMKPFCASRRGMISSSTAPTTGLPSPAI